MVVQYLTQDQHNLHSSASLLNPALKSPLFTNSFNQEVSLAQRLLLTTDDLAVKQSKLKGAQGSYDINNQGGDGVVP